jgi:hypothetical protein
MTLGDVDAGYSYNATLQSNTLAWTAQPENQYLMLAGAGALVLIFLMSGSSSHRSKRYS